MKTLYYTDIVITRRYQIYCPRRDSSTLKIERFESQII